MESQKQKLYNLDLTTEEALALGFLRWSEQNNLLLIPEVLRKDINPDLEVVSIFGGKSKLADIDGDTRFGVLAYGKIFD